MAIISVEHLNFAYDSTPILKDVNFDIHEGDFVTVVGANGSGKSTLMKLLLGLEKPKSGKVSLFGNETISNELINIGYVPQGGLRSVSEFPATVLEIILLRMKPVIVFKFATKARINEAIRALDHVGMKDYAHVLIGNLSGGQLQRVLIARELMLNPRILFLDEPTSGLDKASIASLFELLDHINDVHKISIVMVTHSTHQESKRINRVLEVEDHMVKELNAHVSI